MAATDTAPLPRTSRWVRLAGWFTMGYWALLGAALIAAVVVVIVVLALVSRTTTPTLSALQFAQNAAWWFPFGVSVHFATSWLGPAVAAGMPRRDFTRSVVVAALAVALSAALVMVALLAAETWIYDRLGWTAGTDPGRATIFDGPIAAYTWGTFLLLAIGGLTGLVVGLTYLRLGSAATLLLPVTLAPMAAVALLAIDPATMFTPILIRIGGTSFGSGSLGFGAATASVVVGLALLALTALATHLLARRVPIPGPSA